VVVSGVVQTVMVTMDIMSGHVKNSRRYVE